jgi:hypothetical protein
MSDSLALIWLYIEVAIGRVRSDSGSDGLGQVSLIKKIIRSRVGFDRADTLLNRTITLLSRTISALIRILGSVSETLILIC